MLYFLVESNMIVYVESLIIKYCTKKPRLHPRGVSSLQGRAIQRVYMGVFVATSLRIKRSAGTKKNNNDVVILALDSLCYSFRFYVHFKI